MDEATQLCSLNLASGSTTTSPTPGVTRSSTVAKRPRDASCLLVYS